jgi:copper chaperone CopZ
MTCAYAVRGALQKIQGVESVEVSLNQGLASMKLKPGNAIAPRQVWDTIKRNGYTVKDTRVVAHGEVVEEGGKPRLKLSGSSQAYDLAGGGAASHRGRTVTISGRLTNTAIEVKEIHDDPAAVR